MKSALNGGLNLSIRDGWWDEWYDGENGWEIPSANGVTDETRRDDLESSALYDLLEHAVVPKFYERDDQGVPPRWIEMVRHTLQTLGPKVLASRMVRDYVEHYYLPAAQSLRRTVGAPDGAEDGEVFDGGPRAGRLPSARRGSVAEDRHHRRRQHRPAGHSGARVEADPDRDRAAGRPGARRGHRAGGAGQGGRRRRASWIR